MLDPCHATSHSPDYVLKCRISKRSRLFTIPYFFVRSFRYTASYRLGFLDFQMYREGGPSFDTHARWVARNAKLSISLILRENRGLRTESKSEVFLFSIDCLIFCHGGQATKTLCCKSRGIKIQTFSLQFYMEFIIVVFTGLELSASCVEWNCSWNI